MQDEDRTKGLRRRYISFDNTGVLTNTLTVGSQETEGSPRKSACEIPDLLRQAQQEVLGHAPEAPSLQWQRTNGLGHAVAPLLQRPRAPFSKTEKQKAYTSAVYYSECFLQGVTPKDADQAALDAEGQYEKWWVNSSFREEPAAAQRDDNRREETSVVSDDSPKCRPLAGEKRKRGSIRDVIDTITVGNHNRRETDRNPRRKALEDNKEDVDLGSAQLLSPPTQSFAIESIPNLTNIAKQQVENIRDEIIETMLRNGGNTGDGAIRSGISILESYYLSGNADTSCSFDLKGTWLTLSKPTFSECLGQNQNGDYIYSLGRMSFDMFRPTTLTCSIQGIFNTIHPLDRKLPCTMPTQVRKAVSKGGSELETPLASNVVVAFTIEPGQTRSGQQVVSREEDTKAQPSDCVIERPIRGIMTNFGYLLPDPDTQNRLSTWFTGGSLEVNDEGEDLEEWRKIFDAIQVPNRDMKAFARVLASKVLLGAEVSDTMEENGNLSYKLKRPIGGQGTVFSDILYMDEMVRIMRGHQGSIFIFRKVLLEEPPPVDM